jgi:hypothetical protein
MALRGLTIALLLFTFSSCYLCAPSSATSNGFIQCLTEHIPSELIITPGSSDFASVLVSTSKNSNFLTNTTVKPICIVTVKDASHVQAAVVCGRWNGVRLRVRSGGHDYEGLSYRSARAEVFAVVDLANLHTITVSTDGCAPTAWVDSGATIGQLYHTIAKTNPELGFPAGECPTIGIGGHFRGGGIGVMMRKHGLAVDHIIDAKLVNANGELLDRATMGEDLFWAIRGGAGESFGIVLSWKVKLVRVPPTVAMLRVTRTVEQGAVDIVTKWQDVAPTLPWEMNVMVRVVQGRQAVFQVLYLGRCDNALPTITSRLPELNATRSDCSEMTWLEAMAVVGFGNTNTTALLDRNVGSSAAFKVKSDYVRRAIDKGVWQKIFDWFSMSASGWVMLEPHGGFMGTVPTDATPYPHRSGVLYVIQYAVFWSAGNDGSASAARNWIDNFYNFMAPYVTTSPREAYVNFRDLDIGENTVANDVSTFDSCKMWGEKYFGGNFWRLAMVKGKVDPTDYFRNEQSIPPLFHHATK